LLAGAGLLYYKGILSSEPVLREKTIPTDANIYVDGESEVDTNLSGTVNIIDSQTSQNPRVAIESSPKMNHKFINQN
jgi:hypothetical protein